MYKKISDIILKNSESLDNVEKASVVSIFCLIGVFGFLNFLFFLIFLAQRVPEMVFLNFTIVIISGINLYILTNVKNLNIGLYLSVINICYYVVGSTYLLGYNKNATAILPIIMMLIHMIFPKKIISLIGNTVLVLIAFCLNIYIDYNVDSIYNDTLNYISIVNNIFAIVASALVIYVKYLSDKIVQEYTAQQIEELEEEAYVDFLTGLWNRRYIEKKLESEECKNSYIVIADIDYFKNINDEYGHLCGDYILKEVSELFKLGFRSFDDVCRWGGEEFLVYMKHVNSLNVMDRINDLRQTIEKSNFEYEGTKINVTVTFGVCKINIGEEVSESINKADEALYFGKNNGRNVVINYVDIEN